MHYLDVISFLGSRNKRMKALKSEITVIRRRLALQASGKVMGKKPRKKFANINNLSNKKSSGNSSGTMPLIVYHFYIKFYP